ncbi:competence type IV pilus minor pilin ComGD [Lysinibacillus sp. NPDC093197]|uniref:competence type IV pilus minor pilin ComGD n=1 Tax=Lysinibacillus sp. NPDC093197 TaxID=3364132 RepID=UPI00380565E1
MNCQKNERGYTLIEIVIVLFVVMTLIAIVTQFSLKVAEAKEIERFFSQIQLDLHYLQTYSMQHKDYIFMKFESSSQRYSIKKDFYTNIYIRPFPKGVELLSDRSTVQTIRFNFRGNVMTPGTVYFKTPQGTKKVVITLGRGRARVE